MEQTPPLKVHWLESGTDITIVDKDFTGASGVGYK